MSKTPKPIVQYHVDGVPITNPSVNMLSGISYFHTKGVDGCEHHVSTKRLKEILAEGGITDVKTAPFEITLSNGKRIHTTVGELAPKAERKPGQHASPRAMAEHAAAGETKPVGPDIEPEPAPAKRRELSGSAAKRLERIGALRAEGDALKAWRAAGEKGPKPATPISDAADAERATEEAKRAEAPQTTAHVAAVKPPAKRPSSPKKATTPKAPAKKAAAKKAASRTNPGRRGRQLAAKAS